MDYPTLRAQMTATLEALRQQIELGVAPPSAGLATIYAEQLDELERANAPIADRLRVVRQVLSAATGRALPVDYRERVTA